MMQTTFWDGISTEPHGMRRKAMSKEEKKQRNKAYYKQNIEKIKATTRAWKKHNPEKQKNWYERNRERIKVSKDAWAKQNPEKAEAIKKQKLERYKKLHKENPERFRKYDRERRSKRPEHYRAIGRKSNRKSKGIINPTGETKYGPCEICGNETKLFFDHNHSTGLFRGWLCTLCNHGLGNFKDNPERLEKAAQYLRNHS